MGFWIVAGRGRAKFFREIQEGYGFPRMKIINFYLSFDARNPYRKNLFCKTVVLTI